MYNKEKNMTLFSIANIINLKYNFFFKNYVDLLINLHIFLKFLERRESERQTHTQTTS